MDCAAHLKFCILLSCHGQDWHNWQAACHLLFEDLSAYVTGMESLEVPSANCLSQRALSEVCTLCQSTKCMVE